MKWRLAFSAAFLTLFLPSSVLAAELRYPVDGDSGKVVIAENEVINDDLYIAGAEVIIRGTVNGSVFAAGGQIKIEGPVNGDLTVLGGTADVSGSVKNSFRFLGGQAELTSPVGSDVLIVGGDFEGSDKASIGRDLIMAGGRLDYSGALGRNLLLRGGEALLAGKITGYADLSADRVSIASTADIGGDLTTRTSTPIELSDRALLGGLVKREITEKSAPPFAINAVSGFWKTLVLFAVAVFLIYVFRKKSEAVVHDFHGRVGRNALWGLAAFFLTIPAALVMFITIIGIPFALATIFLYSLTLYGAAAYMAVFVGQLLRKLVVKEKALGWYDAAVGALALWIVAMIPFLGGLLELGLLIYSLGVMLRIDAKILDLVRKQDLIAHA
jgi:cytoskeletal protein CcmA (bactofilin family)